MNIPTWIWAADPGAVRRAVRRRPAGRGTASAHPEHRRVRALARPLRRHRRRLRRSPVVAGPAASYARAVLRRLDHRVQPLGRQPVRLPADHGPVLRAAGAAAVGADVGHPHRAGPARDLHRAGRGGHRALLLGLLHLRRVPGLHRREARHARARPTTTSTRRTPSSAGSRACCRRRRTSTARSCACSSTARRCGRRCCVVLLSLGTTDLLFALDSIPAIFGLTQEPYIVFAANVFALLGPAPALLPARRPAQPAGLPVDRPRDRARLHRRQAGPRGAARELACRSSTAASRSTVPVPSIGPQPGGHRRSS